MAPETDKYVIMLEVDLVTLKIQLEDLRLSGQFPLS